MGIENRKYQRAYLRFSVEYRGQNIWQKVDTENVSEGGLFVVTDKIEPPGSLVEIMFTFGGKDKRLVCVQGKVAWIRDKPVINPKGENLPRGMGIQFTKFLSLESRKFMAEQIKELNNEKEA